MMKLFNYGIGCSAMLLAAILSGCSSDEPLVQKNPVAEKDETRFIVVSLNSPSEGTRAPEFDFGAKNENAVNRLDFLFYDSEGNQVGEPYTFNSADLDDEFTNQGTGNNVARIWTQVVPVNIQQGKTMPAQVICLVNAEESRATALKGKSLNQLLDIKDGSFYNRDHFVMTNSSFYKNDVRYCATPVQSAQMFSDTSEANKVLDDLSGEDDEKKEAAKKLLVDIYVERSAAKVGLTLEDKDFTYTLANGETGSGDITLHFKPQYWFMNAVDKEMYSTKRFGIPTGEGEGIEMDPSYVDINAKFSTTGMPDSWNDETNSRSYWGCSPSYAANQFPLVSDNVNDLENEPNETYTKHYYSFNDLKNSNTGLGAIAIPYNNGFSISIAGDKSTGYIYTTETTTSIKRINDATNSNPAAAVGSAVIVGHYYAGDTEPTGEYPTFWIDVNDGEKGKYYASEAKAKKTLIARNSFIFSDSEGRTPVNTESTFVLAHPKKAVRALLTDKDNIAGRLVTLQLNSVPSSKLYFWDGTQFAEITATNLAKANAALAGVGYLDMYNKGRTFFNIPVRHLGWPATNEYTDGGTVKKLYENGVYNWANMRLGDLGIVRNHVYTINVTKIEGLGSGLRDDDQPIVPPVHAFKQYVAVRLNILQWNVVPACNIEL